MSAIFGGANAIMVNAYNQHFENTTQFSRRIARNQLTILEKGDNNLFTSSLKKFIGYNKKILEVWGSGKPLRELIFVDDIADACIFFMKKKTNFDISWCCLYCWLT